MGYVEYVGPSEPAVIVQRLKARHQITGYATYGTEALILRFGHKAQQQRCLKLILGLCLLYTAQNLFNCCRVFVIVFVRTHARLP